MDTRYICTLPDELRREIARALRAAGIEGADFDRAMCSRVCDLADTVEL